MKKINEELRQAIVDGMGYEPEIRLSDTSIEAAGISEDGMDYCLSIMVSANEFGYEIVLTEKELKAALKAIKELKP